jgi:hypothetical protein
LQLVFTLLQPKRNQKGLGQEQHPRPKAVAANLNQLNELLFTLLQKVVARNLMKLGLHTKLRVQPQKDGHWETLWSAVRRNGQKVL